MKIQFLNHPRFILPLLFIFFWLPSQSFGQMFSIQESQQRPEKPLGFSTLVGFSLDFASFTYTGDLTGGFDRLDFNDPILRFRINSPNLDVSLGLAGSLTGMDDLSYLNVSGRIFNRLNIKRSPTFVLSVPVQLTTDLKRVRAGSFDTEFQQSSLVFGTGISSDIKLSDRFNFKMHATPNYGFSFAQGSFFGGNLFRFDTRAAIYINNLFGRRALAIAYDFDYRKYDIDGDIYDYDFSSHAVTIGIGL